MITIGCAPKFRFKDVDFSQPQEILQELIERRGKVSSFNAECNIELSTAKLQFTLRGLISKHSDDEWIIQLNGPLGVQLAYLKVLHDKFIVSYSQNSSLASGNIDEPLLIPQLGVSLPSVRSFLQAIMPVVDLSSADHWQIESFNGNSPSELVLRRQNPEISELSIIEVNQTPLKVLKEQRFLNEKLLFSRQFHYQHERDNIPNDLSLHSGGTEIRIRFKSLHINPEGTDNE